MAAPAEKLFIPEQGAPSAAQISASGRLERQPFLPATSWKRKQKNQDHVGWL